MNIQLFRYSGCDDSTLGILYVNGRFECYTLEDEFREFKIDGETRIPAGRYLVEPRKVLSPKTKAYRSKYSWFDWHYQLKDVPGFDYVYIHVGNEENETDGCILVGDAASSNKKVRGKVLDSRSAFETLYYKMRSAYSRGEIIKINVYDEDRILRAGVK